MKNGKDLAEAKLEMVIDRCKELYGNVRKSDLMCSLCEHKGETAGSAKTAMARWGSS